MSDPLSPDSAEDIETLRHNAHRLLAPELYQLLLAVIDRAAKAAPTPVPEPPAAPELQKALNYPPKKGKRDE